MTLLLKGVTARLTPELYDVSTPESAGSLDRMLRRGEDAKLLERSAELLGPLNERTTKRASSDLLQDGGFSVVFPSPHGAGTLGEAGMTAHRGVLHPEEYVNDTVLRDALADALGFTSDEVRSVYRQGRLSTTQGELRARIDARLLALSRAGANMLLLMRVLGFASESDDTWPRSLKNALMRARAAEQVAA